MATRAPLINYYDVLAVPRDAGAAEIEAAYRAGILRFRDQPGGSEQTRRISLAYRALSNPERRREYDAVMSGVPLAEASPAPAREEASVAPSETVSRDAPFRSEGPDEREIPGGYVPAPDDSHPETSLERDLEGREYEEDQEDRDERGRRGRLIAIWVVALGLVGLLAMLAGGIFDSDRKLASRDAQPESSGSGPIVDSDAGGRAEQFNGNQVADAGTVEPVEVAETTVPVIAPPAADSILAAPPAERAGGSQALPGATGQAARENASEAAATSASEQAEAVASADNQPAADSQVATAEPALPPPLPTPAPDRSARARLLGGGLVNADNVGGQFQGTVGVRIAVGPSGRPSGCQVTRSSGNAGLDSTTCRLLQQRLQFSPARDRNGNPTTTVVESTHVWGRRQRR